MCESMTSLIKEANFYSDNHPIVYHYCSADSFLAICKSQKLRLSEIKSMNDFMELEWGISLWQQVLKIDNFKYSEGWTKPLLDKLLLSRQVFSPFAACFSIKKDLLSQWRAYCNDGEGFCIGFDATLLSEMPVNFYKMIYDYQSQIESLQKIAKEMELFFQDNLYIDEKGINNIARVLYFTLSNLKNSAFSEEHEVRILKSFQWGLKNENLVLEDTPAIDVKGQAIELSEISYQIKNNRLVPYVDLKLNILEKSSIFKEVWIGPKNRSSVEETKIHLATMGIYNVDVFKSYASYR